MDSSKKLEVTITRPMLSGTATDSDLDNLEWPMLCSPKIDGIRCIMHPHLGPVTRSFKLLPNNHIRDILRMNDV
jgi:hypothetical protein